VNKSELIDQIAKAAGLSKAAAGRSLDAATAAITKALKKNDPVTLIGFGTFYVGKRAARSGRTATGSSTRSTRTCPSISSRCSSSRATCCPARGRAQSSPRASTATRC